jgi:hypothetical protein
MQHEASATSGTVLDLLQIISHFVQKAVQWIAVEGSRGQQTFQWESENQLFCYRHVPSFRNCVLSLFSFIVLSHCSFPSFSPAPVLPSSSWTFTKQFSKLYCFVQQVSKRRYQWCIRQANKP